MPTTNATNTMIGAAVDALRRTPVRRFACASTPSRPRKSSPNGAATTGTTSGASTANAVTKVNVALMDSGRAASPPTAGTRISSAMLPARKSRPITQRDAVITRAAAPRSRSASSGWTRDARRDAASTPSTATPTPVPTDT